MFDHLVAEAADTAGADAVNAWTRVENAACARRLSGMVTMLDARYAASGSADRDQWCLDNWAAVCAEIGAAQQLTSGAASHLLLVAVALRDRLPKVAALFTAGVIGYRLIATIVHRSALIKDPAALRAVDAALARTVQEWGPISLDKTDQAIDALITEFDPYALRRTQGNARSHSVEVYLDDASGVATLWASLFATDAKAFDERLDALAATTCDADPRTRDQRRADAVGALTAGADRLTCLCGNAECLAAANPPASNVVIHVVAHHDTITTIDANPTPDPEDPPANTPAAQHDSLDGESPPMFSKPLREMTLAEVIRESNSDPGEPFATPPGVIIGGSILPGPVVARAAISATIVPIIHPGNAPPEPRHTPSNALADFVRCRDVTCRFPGCKVAATRCDVDHTIAYPHGPTCASNLKCLCRFHHLLKTFWGGPHGWRDRQLPDGTVIWNSPTGQEHTTHPGSRLLFPTLCLPTAPATVTDAPTAHTAGLTMPRRKTTRAQDRRQRIDDERRRNELDPPVEWARRSEPPPF
ncbi:MULTISPECIES: HNH endonuclease signature motif containing protein [unclassified Mycobacterium]|uniref:HNH endonuclease signature motif containing protein n=1 Tax=unclassified Mycobacterium TaxID=2642494 RepID=UPI0029C93149|nr:MULTISPECIES: DUF222 domain-containing protein [unclassified Mycobacterium]